MRAVLSIYFIIEIMLLYASSFLSLRVATRRRICFTNCASGFNAHDVSLLPTVTADLHDLDKDSYRSQVISWYPGHIAKAEKELSDYIKKVDVVIEVRDARIPFATTHPSVPSWVGSKPLIIAIGRIDQISDEALSKWKEHYAVNSAHAERPDAKVFFINGKIGTGVLALRKEALKAGVAVNDMRTRRGIEPRAIRAAVIGFPNVGKSALINRLLGRKMAPSRNLPGVTKALRWVRMSGSSGAKSNTIELLDSPGIIPAKQFDQQGALKLAICNDIGQASYDRVVVAGEMCDQLIKLHRCHGKEFVDMNALRNRYKIPFDTMTGDEILYKIADQYCKGDSIAAADKLLSEFRKGLTKCGSLEAPETLPVSGTSKDAISNKACKYSRKSFYTLDVGNGDYEGW